MGNICTPKADSLEVAHPVSQAGRPSTIRTYSFDNIADLVKKDVSRLSQEIRRSVTSLRGKNKKPKAHSCTQIIHVSLQKAELPKNIEALEEAKTATKAEAKTKKADKAVAVQTTIETESKAATQPASDASNKSSKLDASLAAFIEAIFTQGLNQVEAGKSEFQTCQLVK